MGAVYPIILVLMLTSVAITLVAISNSIVDLKALHLTELNGGRRLVAWQSIRRELINLMIQCVLFGAVVWSQRLELGPYTDNLMLRRNYFAALASQLLMIKTLLDLIGARRLRMIQRGEAERLAREWGSTAL